MIYLAPSNQFNIHLISAADKDYLLQLNVSLVYNSLVLAYLDSSPPQLKH